MTRVIFVRVAHTLAKLNFLELNLSPPPNKKQYTHILSLLFLAGEHQSHLLNQIKKEFPLSEKETQVMMRGRNAVTKSKNRRNPAAYQDSTAFECLLGYLYIENPSRCQELLLWLEQRVDNQP